MRTRSKVAVVLAAALSIFLLAGLPGAYALGSNGGLLGPVTDIVEDVVGDDVLRPVIDVIDTVAGGGTKARPAAASADASDDDSPGHETEDPSGPDHASGAVVDADLADGDLADASSTDATIEDDGRASGDATALALLGTEIVGAHADSEGTGSEEFDLLGPICDASGGALCVQLLYASTTSSADASGSSSEAHSALLFLCLGGTATNADQHCDGPVGAGVGESHSGIERDASGVTRAAHTSDAADVCLGGEDATTGSCSTLGVGALNSGAGADSATGTAARGSQVLGIEAMGQNNPILPDPMGVTILPDCPPDLGVVCLFVNQGESLLGLDTSARQEGLHLGLLNDLALVHASTAEVRVHTAAVAPTCEGGAAIPIDGICPEPVGRAPVGSVPVGSVPLPRNLATTGMNPLIPLALALNLLAFGAWAILWDRRQHAMRP